MNRDSTVKKKMAMGRMSQPLPVVTGGKIGMSIAGFLQKVDWGSPTSHNCDMFLTVFAF